MIDRSDLRTANNNFITSLHTSKMSKRGPPPKKESILELAKLMDAAVRVKCVGGRELLGTLKGYDDLVNLVLDDCDEFLRGEYLVFICILID